MWTTPGDDSTLVEYRSSGNDFKVSAPGFGVILHDAGVNGLSTALTMGSPADPIHARGRPDPLRRAFLLTRCTSLPSES